MATVTLRSCDGRDFVVERANVERASALIRENLEIGGDDDDDAATVPIEVQVAARTLRPIVAYMQSGEVPDSVRRATELSDRFVAEVARLDQLPAIEAVLQSQALDSAYTRMKADLNTIDQTSLYELILASEFLQIDALQRLACLAVANMMRNLTAREIGALFNITCDYSQAELDYVNREIFYVHVRT